MPTCRSLIGRRARLVASAEEGRTSGEEDVRRAEAEDEGKEPTAVV